MAIIGGDLVGIEVAEHLAARGHLVAVLEAGDEIATDVGPKRRTEHMNRLDRFGVTVHTSVTVEKVLTDGVALTPDGGTTRQLAADAVVLAGTVVPDLTLRDAIASRLPDIEVRAVGDCTGPGLIRQATEHALRAVHALELS